MPFSPQNPTGLDINSFIEKSPIAVVRLDEQGYMLEFNQSFSQLVQQTISPESPSKLIDVIDTEDRPKFAEAVEKTFRDHTDVAPLSLALKLSNANTVMVYCYITLMRPDNGMKPVLMLHMVDQTEQKNLEMRFSHSQKMQAVGQLAGGVAHDFNNLLTAMIGFCDLLLMRHPAGDPSFADIMQVKQNANRAANLVRQLLAFSRRQTLQPKMLDITDLLAELSNLIRRLIGENIQMKMSHGRELGMVKADQGQLEQVIINLAVNARDAMPNGGTLIIRTSDVRIPANYTLPRGVIAPSADDEMMVPGEYILVEVEDTGSGIPPEIIKSIFEPFFSTKEVGSGTGLGLATCYGIIKQTGGYIYVKSEVGIGTNFMLYFKRFQQEQVTIKTAEVAPEASGSDLTGKATILLVEDETPVRIFAARALRNKGYEVLEADSGENAVDVYTAHAGEVDLIISDVVMPGMNGPKMILTLEEQCATRMQHTKVVFISGYAEDAFMDSFGADRTFNFLPKPFTLKQLASKVKEVLEGSAENE
jgi:two-component system cell cycle sensor histidine kinase/response regulator CckA